MRTKFLMTPHQHREKAARLRIVDPRAPLLETLEFLELARAHEEIARAIEVQWAQEDERDRNLLS